MLYWWSAAAFGAGTTPDDRVEVWSDMGIMTSQVGLAFGFGAGLHERRWTLLGTAGVGGRGNLFQTGVSARPGFGLATLATAFDLDAAGSVAVVVLLDSALLDTVEQDCGNPTRSACRHYLFVGTERQPALGVSLQPAAGLRIVGAGSSGSRFSTTLGIQPHRIRDLQLWYAPRFDISIGESSWSAHLWGDRYGLAIGVGHRLSRPRER